MHSAFTFVTLVASIGAATAGEDTSAPTAITAKFYHLGDSKKPEWKDFTTVDPVHAKRIDVDFTSGARTRAATLELHAGGVGKDWKVLLNDKALGLLKKNEALTVQFLAVPPGTLKEGKNRVSVVNEGTSDDVYVGKLTLHDRPLQDVLGASRVHVTITEAGSGEPLPCRITVTRLTGNAPNEKEEALQEAAGKDETLAQRKGIIYTRNGNAPLDLVPGRYRVTATRGFEYGKAEAIVEIAAGRKPDAVALSLAREVDTAGLLAIDTHMHTKTYSGHGDINLEERMVTIAGEGVEVAVATDHNHLTDYEDLIRQAGLQGRFLSIIGDEVTASIAHCNAFPFAVGAKPSRHSSASWAGLINDIRSSPGVRVVILNHPHRVENNITTMGRLRLNPLSGEAHAGPEALGVDAIELINAKSLPRDRWATLRDWFGLLNRGQRITGVAASDSHAVTEIVGQGRTYVASPTDDPAKANAEDIAAAIRAGKAVASLGLLPRVCVAGKFTMGDLATGLASPVEVEVQVQGPSWVRADEVVLLLNGIEVRKAKIPPSEKAVKLSETWKIELPRHDVHLVVVTSGPPVTAPYWPVSAGSNGYVLGATNPVWIDGDGDGKFTSALEYADRLTKEHGTGPAAIEKALAGFDEAVAIQAASLVRSSVEKEAQAAYERIMAEADAKLERLLDSASSASDRLREYLVNSPKVEVRTRAEAEKAAGAAKAQQKGSTGEPAKGTATEASKTSSPKGSGTTEKAAKT